MIIQLTVKNKLIGWTLWIFLHMSWLCCGPVLFLLWWLTACYVTHPWSAFLMQVLTCGTHERTIHPFLSAQMIIYSCQWVLSLSSGNTPPALCLSFTVTLSCLSSRIASWFASSFSFLSFQSWLSCHSVAIMIQLLKFPWWWVIQTGLSSDPTLFYHCAEYIFPLGAADMSYTAGLAAFEHISVLEHKFMQAASWDRLGDVLDVPLHVGNKLL